MNARVLAFIKMLETLITMVDANLARFTVIPAFAEPYGEIKAKYAAIQVLKPIAIKKTKPQTDANNALKITLSDMTEAVASPVLSLAGKLNDIALKEQMSVKAYKLKRLSQNIITATCQNVHTTATAHKVAAAAYNLTQDMLDELEDLITLYTAEMPEVSTETDEINAAKRDIEKLKGRTEEILEGQLDPMVKILDKSDPNALELWNSARAIDDPASTKTQAKLKVYTIDNGVVVLLPDVTIQVVGALTYTVISNELGEAKIKPIAFGKYNIVVNHPGFKPFLLEDYKMVKGKINKPVIRLIRL